MLLKLSTRTCTKRLSTGDLISISKMHQSSPQKIRHGSKGILKKRKS
ncbi:hypothetical protein MTR67_026759 [Solanum verrucosum]|uniref:Uncharacterized protein n=1 Tax=Solanum verrucosum TaxID=315347 RepID=A0AAF0QZJ5_SOLVR|nr:hypothetical protein MTR67_026759 [Solanum verrucosum]